MSVAIREQIPAACTRLSYLGTYEFWDDGGDKERIYRATYPKNKVNIRVLLSFNLVIGAVESGEECARQNLAYNWGVGNNINSRDDQYGKEQKGLFFLQTKIFLIKNNVVTGNFLKQSPNHASYNAIYNHRGRKYPKGDLFLILVVLGRGGQDAGSRSQVPAGKHYNLKRI